MRILLSNDDGVHAPGLNALATALKAAGHDIFVIAPDRDRSGASNSLTLDRPLHPVKTGEGHLSINGTPTDCVHLGINRLCQPAPDIVIAGINAGANLGDDVLYSGTVAAAMEGRFLQRPPIAVSLVGHGNFATAAQFIVLWLPKLAELKLPPRTVLNINIPDVLPEQLKGVSLTRLGHRARSDNPVETKNPRGKTCYWISAAGQGADAGEGTDFYAIEQGMVSITPLQVDMTAYAAMEAVGAVL
ncbi:MAG: 5'/3'-nucleotidase SurE [Oceanospirillaceae bacterium]|nr:5'/3'-nucleotidase SurE [Oceanospirillaceae bacterium]